jgi:peptidoglycan/LPS O-acetylase OafA/YrhL
MDIAGTAPGITTTPALPSDLTEVGRKERLLYIQAMRAIAIAIVVATHCRDPFADSTIIKSAETGVLFRHINIVFIFISGFLFQFLLRKFSYFPYLRAKLKNVITPYIICSIPAIAAYLIGIKSVDGLGAPLWVDSAPKLVLYMLVTGTHMAPFWFIPMMALIYLISPTLVWVDRIRWGYLVIVPLLVASLAVGRSTGDSNPAHNFLFYLPVYVIGMAVSHFRNGLIPQLSRYFPALLLFIALPLIDISADRWVDNVEFITKIAFCLGLTGMFARFSVKLPTWIDYLGSISFGIYFIHYYAVAILTIASKSALRPFFNGGLTAYALTVLTVLSLSIIGVIMLKAILRRHSRMIIGA